MDFSFITNFITNLHFKITLDMVIGFLVSPEIQHRLLWVKFGFLLFSLIILISIVVLMLKTHYYQWLFVQDVFELITFRPFGAKRITKTWNKIIGRLDANVESESKMAVIEADDLMDASLKKLGYTGSTFEEKLGKLSKATVGNLTDLYSAHKIRNTIVHDPDFRLSQEEAKATLDIYQKAFVSLQVLG